LGEFFALTLATLFGRAGIYNADTPLSQTRITSRNTSAPSKAWLTPRSSIISYMLQLQGAAF